VALEEARARRGGSRTSGVSGAGSSRSKEVGEEGEGEVEVEDGGEEGVCLEDRALEMAVAEMYAESGGRWKPWAENGKAIRVGEIILLVDADTIVPEVCACVF
jgi:hypothetical protein